jgi:hypothetical protein
MGSTVEALRVAFTSFLSSRLVDAYLFSQSTSSAHGCFHFIFLSVISAFSAPTLLGSFFNGTIFGVILYSSIPVHYVMGMPPDILRVNTYQRTELSRKILP